jgi:hypothetical protein
MRFGPQDGNWCKVEIMGHREHIARVLAVPMLDGKAWRVCDEAEGAEIFYGIGAIFSMRWLTDEEGEALSAERAEQQAKRDAAVARGAKIGGIQQKIREVVGARKMHKADIIAATMAALPGHDLLDVEEAFAGSWLTVCSQGLTEEGDLWWLDDEDTPF